jgi:hypothetical protein
MFLKYYQATQDEAILSTNIVSVWRVTGLLPFDPSVILKKILLTTPSCISFTDKNGHKFNIPVSPSIEERLTKIFGQLLQGALPLRS